MRSAFRAAMFDDIWEPVDDVGIFTAIRYCFPATTAPRRRCNIKLSSDAVSQASSQPSGAEEAAP